MRIRFSIAGSLYGIALIASYLLYFTVIGEMSGLLPSGLYFIYHFLFTIPFVGFLAVNAISNLIQKQSNVVILLVFLALSLQLIATNHLVRAFDIVWLNLTEDDIAARMAENADRDKGLRIMFRGSSGFLPGSETSDFFVHDENANGMPESMLLKLWRPRVPGKYAASLDADSCTPHVRKIIGHYYKISTNCFFKE